MSHKAQVLVCKTCYFLVKATAILVVANSFWTPALSRFFTCRRFLNSHTQKIPWSPYDHYSYLTETLKVSHLPRVKVQWTVNWGLASQKFSSRSCVLFLYALQLLMNLMSGSCPWPTDNGKFLSIHRDFLYLPLWVNWALWIRDLIWVTIHPQWDVLPVFWTLVQSCHRAVISCTCR